MKSDMLRIGMNYARLRYFSVSASLNSDVTVKVVPKPVKKKEKELIKKVPDNVYITPNRAMDEYLLQHKHLDRLQKYNRRNPYSEYGDIQVVLRSDVENIASDVHGTFENLDRKKDFLRETQDVGNLNIGEMKKEIKTLTKDYREQHKKSIEELPHLFKPFEKSKSDKHVFKTHSGKVVAYAVGVNAANCVMKLCAWIATGSNCMFSEFIHSVADTANQLILAYGLHKSAQEADKEHPYGWGNFRNVASLISGVGIFFSGCSLCIFQGILAISEPAVFEHSIWAPIILASSLISESATLGYAIYAVKIQSKNEKMNFLEYINRAADPSTTVVLLEDLASVVGVAFASGFMYLTYITNNGVFDGVGSVLIGSLLGMTASFVIYTNTQFLVGRSITPEKEKAMMAELEADRIIRALLDVKATEMGGSSIRFKAEVDFDGKEISRLYLENHLKQLYQEHQKIQNAEELEQFLLKYGENIVDFMGSEIDRIENNFKKRHPEVRHVDLEQL